MTPRPSTNRPRVPTLFAFGWLAVWPFIAGCQSGAQQDLVARELRMHEDQIYAMEDYITQYQQLVCKYRSENAALRQRLTDEYYDEGALPAPRQRPRTDGSRTTPPGGTSIEIRETPGREGEQPPSREIEIEMPEVPPLEGSTLNEFGPTEVVSAVHLEPNTTTSGEAASAAGNRHVKPSIKPTGKARVQKIVEQSDTPLRLHGEVVASDPGGGARVIVNLECTDELKNGGTFDGNASLMLLAPNRPRGQQSLARWDFSADDVQTAKQDADDERTMRFYLELPAGTPINQTAELWVRLVPHEGEKLLAHTNVDLGMPGRFASSTESKINQTSAGFSVAALAGVTSMRAQFSANVLEGDWSIARPGEPANLPSAEEILTGGWRTSSEPIANVAQASAITKPKPPVVQQASHVEDLSESKPARAYKAPTWSPERSRDVAAHSDASAASDSSRPQLPPWAATR